MTSPVFVRALFGDSSVPRSQGKIRDDVRGAVERQKRINKDTITYVYGTDNLQFLRSLGFSNLVLMHPNGVIYPQATFWKHKLDVWVRAAQDHREWLFCDFDFVNLQPIPPTFWSALRAKSDICAPLMQRARRRVLWRGKYDTRKLPSAGFTYFNETASDHLKEVVRIFDEQAAMAIKDRPNMNGAAFTEEQALAYYLDHYIDGFGPESKGMGGLNNVGPIGWWHRREPVWVLPCNSALPHEFQQRKIGIFSFKPPRGH